jgi:uncharacterized protein
MKRLWLWPMLALLTACTEVPTLPPVSDSGKFLPGKFIWRDLITPDPAAAQTFYHELFGWDFEALGGSGYSLIRHNGDLVGGMVDANKIGQPVQSAMWLSGISVPDVRQAVRAATGAGGRVIHQPRNLANRGRVAVVMDGDGAVFQLIQSRGGDPLDIDPKINQWLWTELIANDVEAASDFYQNVAGYDVEAATGMKNSYRLLLVDGTPRGGILENPFEDTRSAWVPYVRVSDPEKLSKKAAELGGRVVVETSKDIRNGTVAMILDPSGAPVALQKWSGGKKEGI